MSTKIIVTDEDFSPERQVRSQHSLYIHATTEDRPRQRLKPHFINPSTLNIYHSNNPEANDVRNVNTPIDRCIVGLRGGLSATFPPF